MYVKTLLMTATLLLGQVHAQTTSTTPAPVKKETTKKKKKKVIPTDTAAPAQTSTATAPTTPVAEVKVEEKKSETKPNETQLTPAKKVLKYLKEHFSASYHGEFYFQRRMDDYISAAVKNEKDKDIQDIRYMHNPTVIYKPTPNWQVLATAEFKYTDALAKGTFVNDYYRSLVTLTRKNLLTEKEYGFGLDLGIGRRDFNTRTSPSNYGNSRVFTTISKTFGKHSGSLFVQYLNNDPKKSTATTWKHGLEVIPTLNLQLTQKLSYLFNDDINFNTPKYKTTKRDLSITHEMNVAYLNYQWNDKIATYYQLKYYHIEDFTTNFQSKDDWMEHYAGITYSFTPKISITGEVGNEIIHAHDRRDFFAEKAAYPELALYLDAAF